MVDAAKAMELATGKSSADSVVLTDPSFDPSPPFSGASVSLTLQAHWQDGVVIPSGKVSCSALVGGTASTGLRWPVVEWERPMLFSSTAG